MLSTQQIGLLFIYSGTYARCFLLLEIWSTSGELDSETVIVVPLCVWRFLISIQCYLAANRNWFCFHTIETDRSERRGDSNRIQDRVLYAANCLHSLSRQDWMEQGDLTGQSGRTIPQFSSYNCWIIILAQKDYIPLLAFLILSPRSNVGPHG